MAGHAGFDSLGSPGARQQSVSSGCFGSTMTRSALARVAQTQAQEIPDLGRVVRLDDHVTDHLGRNRLRMMSVRVDEPPAVGASTADQLLDLELIRAVAGRDRRAFERLYYRHSPLLGRYLMRLLREQEAVEEVLNDVMLVVWQSAARYDPAVARLSTWLFGIAHNKALKVFARRRTASNEVQLEPLDVEADVETDADDPGTGLDAHDPERTLAARQLGRLLASALEELSSEHRCVIELAFGEDYSYQEIATITDCPLNTVKTRMFYARKRLADILKKWGLGDSFGT
jgi:RNA polymerase sigma-70 factor, ECF subfamily